MDDVLTIGAVSSLSGLPVDTIRFYEKKGLIDPPPRNASGYRVYQPEIVDLLTFIKRSRELLFSLEEINKLIAVLFRDEGSVDEVHRITREKIGEIEGQLEQLGAAKHHLQLFTEICKNPEEREKATLLGYFLNIG